MTNSNPQAWQNTETSATLWDNSTDEERLTKAKDETQKLMVKEMQLSKLLY